MHNVQMNPAIEARIRQRRNGQLHRFERIDPKRTAQVVIDMQSGFLSPGSMVEIPMAREIVPGINAISGAARETGATNIFVRFATSPDDIDLWSNFYATFAEGAAAHYRAAFAPGAPPWELWPALDINGAIDKAIDKRRFSAFVPGTCDLDALLSAGGIDTIIITGTLTNCCCEATARDAMQLNYRVIMVSDATAAMSDAEHNASLDSLSDVYADVRTSQEVIAMLHGDTPEG